MGLNFGGLLSFGASALGITLPAANGGSPQAAPLRPAGGQQVGMTPVGGGVITPGAPTIIGLILDGSGDAAVRTAARMARVGKKQLLETLVAMDIASGNRAFTGTEKIFVSNEIEKIFKPRRRSTISRSLRRTVAQLNWMKKNLRGFFK